MSQDSGNYVLLLLVRRMDAYKSVSSIVFVCVCFVPRVCFASLPVGFWRRVSEREFFVVSGFRFLFSYKQFFHEE
jgi:hypothetical protein